MTSKRKSDGPLSTEVPPRKKLYLDMRYWDPETKRVRHVNGSTIVLENFSPAEARAVICRALTDYANAHQQQDSAATKKETTDAEESTQQAGPGAPAGAAE